MGATYPGRDPTCTLKASTFISYTQITQQTRTDGQSLICFYYSLLPPATRGTVILNKEGARKQV